jgi:hypothetical protein
VSDADIASLERDFASCAADLCAFAEHQQLLWRQRLRHGRPISDRFLGVTCQSHPSDSKLCQLQFRDQGEVVETVEMWRTHADALRALHLSQRQRAAAAAAATATGPPGGTDDKLEAGLVLTRIFTMALRYDSLSGCKCAYQAALPPPVMDLLASELGCAHECFASPLNQRLGSFCSAFPDTDAAFGSKGSFFDFRPTEGSYECNPPFDSRSIDACLEHVLSLLQASDRPLSFVVTVPSLEGSHSDCRGGAFRALDAFKSTAVEVRAKDHSYLMGLQHRRQRDGLYWSPEIPSTAYVYQNARGRQRWPVRGTFSDQLRRAWDWRGKK